MIARHSCAVFLTVALMLAGIGGCSVSSAQMVAHNQKPNVLFIIVDDLRPELGCYGNEIVHSPNIDRIARNGLTFDRAYSQFPVCGPSRCSILSGLRPTRTRFASNAAMVDNDAPEIVPLPEFFKTNGYYTISNGKVYHDHGNTIDGMDGWSEIPWEPHPGFWVWRDLENQTHSYRGYRYRQEYLKDPGPSYEAPDVPDNAYPTGIVTEKSLSDLRRLKEAGVPFFLAVGYRKPHLPHNAPKKYWDLYRPEHFQLADNFKEFSNIPNQAFHNSPELRAYEDIPEQGKIDEATWRKLMHGYYACISYTDAQIGRLLDELEKLGLKENTIVVLLGDHGYQLTDHGMWSKGTNFRTALRAPLIFSGPGIPVNRHETAVTELVDIYPSLAELCIPGKAPYHLQGNSFVSRLTDSKTQHKQVAFSRTSTGESIITEKYIYTEWFDQKGQVIEKMLFDLEKDPDEVNNLSGVREHQKLIRALSHQLQDKIRELNADASAGDEEQLRK